MAYDLKAVFKIQDDATAAIRKITREMEKLDRAMKDVQIASQQVNSAFGNHGSSISNTTTIINHNTNIVNNNTNALNSNANAANNTATSISNSMNNMAIATTIAYAAIGAAAVTTMKTFMDFDNEMRKAGAIAGASAKEFDAMKEAAIDLGGSTSKSASEVANAMSEMAASGFSATQVIAAMPGVISASEASGESLAVASETVAAALNIFSLEAAESTRVADILAEAANSTAAGITDMQYALKYAGAPAAALGISLEETAGAIGLMSNAGIDGSSAGTALRASLLALNNPAKAQEKMMESYGINLYDTEGKMLSLSGIIGELSDSMNGLTDAEKTATLAKLVGTEAVSGFLALMKAGPKEIDKMTAALENSGGASEATAKQMMDGIGGAWLELTGSIESHMIRMGDAVDEPLRTLALLFSKIDTEPLVAGLEKMANAASKFIEAIVNNWDTIGPIISTAAKGVGILIGAFLTVGTLTIGFIAIKAAIAMMLSPIGLIVLGIAAIGTAFVSAYQNSEAFRNFIDGIIVKAKELFAAFKSDGISGVLSTLLPPGMIEEITSFVNTIKTTFASIKEYISAKITELQPTFDMLSNTFTNIKDIVTTALTTLWSIAGPILSLLWGALQILGDIAVIVFNNIISPALQMATTAASILWSVMGPIFSLLGAILQVVGEVVLWLWNTAFKPFFSYVTSGMSELSERVMPVLDRMKSVFETIGEAISTAVGHVKNFTSSLRNVKIPDWMSKVGSGAMNIVSKMIPGNYHGLSSVPYDNYLTNLHKGEMVLTRQDADTYRTLFNNDGSLSGVSAVDGVSYEQASAGLTQNTYNSTSTTVNNGKGDAKSTQSAPNVNIAKLADQVIVREEGDIEKVAYRLAKLIERERMQIG